MRVRGRVAGAMRDTGSTLRFWGEGAALTGEASILTLPLQFSFFKRRASWKPVTNIPRMPYLTRVPRKQGQICLRRKSLRREVSTFSGNGLRPVLGSPVTCERTVWTKVRCGFLSFDLRLASHSSKHSLDMIPLASVVPSAMVRTWVMKISMLVLGASGFPARVARALISCLMSRTRT